MASTKKPIDTTENKEVIEDVVTVKTMKAVVNAQKLNVRSRMSIESEVVTVVNLNDELVVESTKSVQWYKVNSPVNGFVKSDFITIK